MTPHHIHVTWNQAYSNDCLDSILYRTASLLHITSSIPHPPIILSSPSLSPFPLHFSHLPLLSTPPTPPPPPPPPILSPLLSLSLSHCLVTPLTLPPTHTHAPPYHHALSQISCISSSIALSNRTRYRAYYQMLPSEADIAIAVVGGIQFYGWRYIAIITQNENILTLVSLGILVWTSILHCVSLLVFNTWKYYENTIN